MADRANMQSQEDEVKSAAERLYSNDLCMDAIYAFIYDPDGYASLTEHHRSPIRYEYYLGWKISESECFRRGHPVNYRRPKTLWCVSLSDKIGYRRTAKYLYHTVPETMIRRMIESDHDTVGHSFLGND